MADQSVIKELQDRIAAMESGGEVPECPNEQPQVGVDEAPTNKQNDALKKIIALVNASDKSERTIRDRLAREGFSQPEIESAVDQARQYGFIDDKRFAEVLVRSRTGEGERRHNPRTRRKRHRCRYRAWMALRLPAFNRGGNRPRHRFAQAQAAPCEEQARSSVPTSHAEGIPEHGRIICRAHMVRKPLRVKTTQKFPLFLWR